MLLFILACSTASGPDLSLLARETRRNIADSEQLALAANDIDANAAVLAAARGEAAPPATREQVTPEEAHARALAIWCPKLEEASGLTCSEALARYAP